MVATVTRLKAAATTVHYFEADGYYAKGDPGAPQGQQAGTGRHAALMGLHGPVKPKRFEELLAGYVPGTDIRLGRLRDGEHQHRPGVDVTLSLRRSQYPWRRWSTRRRRPARGWLRAARRGGTRHAGLHRDRAVADPELRPGNRAPAQGGGRRHGCGDFPASRKPQPRPAAAHARGDRQHDPRPERGVAERRVHRRRAVEAADRRLLPHTSCAWGSRKSATPTVADAGGSGCRGSRSRATASRCWTRSRPAAASCWTTCRSGVGRTPRREHSRQRFTHDSAKAEPDRQVLRETWQALGAGTGPGARSRHGARPQRRRSVGVSTERGASGSVGAVVVRQARRAPGGAAHGILRQRPAGRGRWPMGAGGIPSTALDAGIRRLRRDGHLIEATARRADLAFVTDRAAQRPSARLSPACAPA